MSLDRLSLLWSAALPPRFRPIWKLFLPLFWLGLLSLCSLADDLLLALLTGGSSKKSPVFMSKSWFFNTLFCFCNFINSSFFLFMSIFTLFNMLISTWQYFSSSLSSRTTLLYSSTLYCRGCNAEFGVTKILLNLREWVGWLVIKLVLLCPSLISFSAWSISSILSLS